MQRSVAAASNPFEFGRELGADELVDRRDEVREVVSAAREGGKLFVIGPRRYGKTSILKAAAETAERSGVVVLRHDAEAYPDLDRLAGAIVEQAAAALTPSVQKAGEWIKRFFTALRPMASYDPVQQSWNVGFASRPPGQAATAGLLVDVLSGVEAMAAAAGRPVAVVIDEFQHVVEQEGIAAERQIRAAIQKHAHVGYVFAGSQTRLLAEMTGDPARPFYRLGARLFVREIPREDFVPFLAKGFRDAGFECGDDAVAALLDRAEDVPYNVQRLAHLCWNRLRDDGERRLTPAFVDATLERLVRQDDPFYTQLWNGLNRTQQRALVALVQRGGKGLFAKETLRVTGMALSTMQRALEALEKKGIVREDEQVGEVRLRLEDPFFAAWLRVIGALPA